MTRVPARAALTIPPTSPEFWASTGRARKTFMPNAREPADLWHRLVPNGLFEDPNDPGFWAVVRHADLVEVTRRPRTSCPAGILFEFFDAGRIPSDAYRVSSPWIRPGTPKIRLIWRRRFTAPKRLAASMDHIVANAAASSTTSPTKG